MSSAGENRQHFCESRREEEDGDNTDVDEDDEDDEEVDMAIRNEIKRRAERLLNVHQKWKMERCTSFVVERSMCTQFSYFLFHFCNINFVEYHRNPLLFVVTLSAFDSIITKISSVISSVRI